MLRGFIPNYDKTVDFGSYVNGYTEAVRRAERLDQDAKVR
jgi:hypothetical protein